MSKRQIYLDYNATTPLHPEVRRAMIEAMDAFGNPSSAHWLGREAKRLVEEARVKVADFIGADPEETIFTGSGSEANNMVLMMLVFAQRRAGCNLGDKRSLITTEIEHPSVLEPSKFLKDLGLDVSYLHPDCLGKVVTGELEKMTSEKKGIVSIMMANNEIGTLQDIKNLVEIAHEKESLFHTDAVQAVGKIPVNVKELDVDFLSLSGHKIYGPKGIGALYVKTGTPLCPIIQGGHQEKERRAGTENTLGIIGLGKAVEMRAKEMEGEEKRLKGFKELLKEGIKERIQDVRFNGHPLDCLTNTLNVSFDSAEGEAILMCLDKEGIAVSTGSACTSDSINPSHVLLATGIPAEHAASTIRISMGRETKLKDVEYLLDKLPAIIKKIRKSS